METDNKKRQLIAGLAVLIVIVVIVAVAGLNKQDDSKTSTTQDTTSTQTSTTSSSAYKDGSYTATGDYSSPGGTQEITISVTLKDGTVAQTSAQSGANDSEAREYQADFIANYKSQVVGKKIDGLSLSRVAGSSLTSNGFNEAIKQIESQAKA